MTKLPALALAALVACHADEAPDVAQVSQRMSVCAAGETTYGIDVSRYQGDIDWDLVADSGVEFAFIQISRSLTDLDAKFAYNWRRAKEVGILRGAYQRFQPDQDVIGQAELFVQKLGPYVAGDLPPVLDVEDAKGLPPATIAARVDEWVTYVEHKVGLRPIIYTGYYFWKDSVAADFSDHHLWIANYSAMCPLVPPSWTNWTFHQYSSTAMIPGITANTVDVNRFNGTLAELQALARPPEPCPPIDDTDAGRIVDDTSTCFFAGGNPAYIRTEVAGVGSSLRWTHTTDEPTPANFGQWSLNFAVAGRYRIEAFTLAPFGMSKQAVYKVHHGDAMTAVTIDQSAVDGWTLIGEFDVVAGEHGQSIRVDDNTGEPNSTNTKLVFDAVRVTRSEEPAEVPDVATDGCASTRGERSLVVLLVFGSLVYGTNARRRRRAHRTDAARIRR